MPKAALLALVLLASPATAADDIFGLYAAGDYEQAARAGEAAHTAPGLAIAARAVLADEVLRDQPCMPCLKRAETLARQAIAIDPHHAFAQVWLAVALGYQARLTGTVRARLADAPGQSQRALEAAVHDEPRNAYAVSALGGWNIEVVRGGGHYLARLLYGATEEKALTLFDQAVGLAPANVAVRYQIALSLAGYDADRFRGRIAAELRASLAARPATAYEQRIQDRANELLGLLNRGPRDAFENRVRKYQGFPD
ncbi:MAG TPA: hypothetical protein VHC40_06250 [Rhizomicrobium sp.]|nr:hypothetical protein [Rhizomicrobium sp.]